MATVRSAVENGHFPVCVPGQELVLTKWAGLQGTVLLAQDQEAALNQYFSEVFVEQAKSLARYLSIETELAAAEAAGACGWLPVGRGGVFGALWEFGKHTGLGLEVDLKRIPIRQETVEVCNFLDVNPYKLHGGGSLLLAADHGFALVRAMEQAGVAASVIGQLQKGNDRVVLNGGEVRYLEPIRVEALELFLERNEGK